MLAKTIATINGAVVSGLEGNFGFLAAVRADDLEHLTRLVAVTSALAFVTAVAATRGLVLEALFGIKFLFARAEDEFFSAVLAHECFVFKSHKKILLTTKKILLLASKPSPRNNTRELYHALQKMQAARNLKRHAALTCLKFFKRAMGIEPTSKAWEALVLPMNYARAT